MKTRCETLLNMKIVRRERIDKFALLELPYCVYRQLSSMLQLPSSEALWASIMKRINLAKNQSLSKILEIDKTNQNISLGDRLNQLALFQLLIVFWNLLGSDSSSILIQERLSFSLEIQQGQLQLTIRGEKNMEKKECSHHLWIFIKENMDRQGYFFQQIQSKDLVISPLNKLNSGKMEWPSIAVYSPAQNKSYLYYMSTTHTGLPLPQYLKVKSYLGWRNKEKQAWLVEFANNLSKKVEESSNNFNYYFVLSPEVVLIQQTSSGSIKVETAIDPISMPFWKKDHLPKNFNECKYSAKQIIQSYTDFDLWSLALILLESSLSEPQHFRKVLSSVQSSDQIIELVKATLLRLKEERQPIPQILEQKILEWMRIRRQKNKTEDSADKQNRKIEIKQKITEIMELYKKDRQNGLIDYSGIFPAQY